MTHHTLALCPGCSRLVPSRGKVLEVHAATAGGVCTGSGVVEQYIATAEAKPWTLPTSTARLR